MSIISTIVFQFLLKYKWKILIILFTFGISSVIYLKVSSHFDEFKELQSANKVLVSEKFDLQEQLLAKEDLIKKQKKSLKISEASLIYEQEAEQHYRQNISNNEKIIIRYVNSEKTKEDTEELYKFLNKKWSEVDQPYKPLENKDEVQ